MHIVNGHSNLQQRYSKQTFGMAIFTKLISKRPSELKMEEKKLGEKFYVELAHVFSN